MLPQLLALADSEGSPDDGVVLDYVNPMTGGPTLPTLGCSVQLLRPGEETKPHRHTSSAVYFVVHGAGRTTVDGKEIDVMPLEGLEAIAIDGEHYEAFNTSGGLGSLGETYGDRVSTMNYKTIRYPGHCEQMRLLMNGLKLNHDRDTLKRILENSVPQTLQDVVIIYAAVTGLQDGELREENYVNKVYPQQVAGRLWSAIQITTAAGICSVLDIVLSEPAKYTGFVTQEQFRLADILDNRFGRFYAQGGTNLTSAELVARGKTGHQRASSGA